MCLDIPSYHYLALPGHCPLKGEGEEVKTGNQDQKVPQPLMTSESRSPIPSSPMPRPDLALRVATIELYHAFKGQ
jgi:hypothetical protein